MKQLCLMMFTCSLLAGPVLASTLFTDDFESGVQSSKWEAVPGVASVQIHVGDSAHAYGTQAAKQVNADPFAYYMRTVSNQFSATPSGSDKVVVSCQFFDDNSLYDQSNTQHGGGLLVGSYAGNGVLNDFYQLLVNSTRANGGVNGHYWIRSSLGTYGDSGVTRTQGWHEFKIEVLPYTGLNDVKYYIDGNYVGAMNRKPGSGSGFPIDDVRVGFSAKSPGLAFWYDNVNASLVPEPASLVLLGLGACCLLRRKA